MAATTASIKLDQLPAELITQIAASTTPETVIALSGVCRSLRETCYDTIVFLESFEDREWANACLGAHKDDIKLIAQYAVAESRHRQLMDVHKASSHVKTTVIPTGNELLRYTPNLVVLGNPVVARDKQFRYGKRFAFMKSMRRSPTAMEGYLKDLGETRLLVSFLYACKTIKTATAPPPTMRLDDERYDHSTLTNHAYNVLINELSGSGDLSRWHGTCLLGVGKFAALLSCPMPAFITDPENHHDYAKGLPLFSKMPVAKTVSDIPPPFLPEAEAIQTWDAWLRRLRRNTSTPEYLDSGEWVGQYIYDEGQPTPLNSINMHLDAPMEEIRFRSRVLPTGGVFSEGEGVDWIGEFDVRLTISSDGYVHGRKAYKDGSVAWAWTMSNTPFGLFGLWTEETGAVGNVGGLGGAVWLWKRAWCEEWGSAQQSLDEVLGDQ